MVNLQKNGLEENETNRPHTTEYKKAEKEHQIEKVGSELREMMPFHQRGNRR